MAAKRLTKANLRETEDAQFARNVMESAQQIWLAGVGAMSLAQKEGSKVFETLVEEGERVESRTRKVATETVDEVKDQMENVKERANRNWDKLEQVFQDRVAKALNSLSVPTRQNLQDLSGQVDALRKHVEELSKS